MSSFETRFEVRELGNGKAQVDVYGSWFNNRYPIAPGVDERVMPGSFLRTLAADPDVSLLVGHGDGGLGLPLASTRPRDRRTMGVRETDKGLLATADLDLADPEVQAVLPKIRAGVCEASFAFTVMKGGQEWNEDFSLRTLTALNLSSFGILES